MSPFGRRKSTSDAAAILEIPIGTVRSRLYRARRVIQDALIAFAEDAGLARRQDRVEMATS
jgi:hypothetical protein